MEVEDRGCNHHYRRRPPGVSTLTPLQSVTSQLQQGDTVYNVYSQFVAYLASILIVKLAVQLIAEFTASAHKSPAGQPADPSIEQ